jgi:biopolymer transport protein ExbD
MASHTFRNRGARAVYESHYGPNMTPMVDVVMVILIFFMASAALMGPEWFLRTSLPIIAATAPKNTTPPTRITIELGAAGEVKLRIDEGEARAVALGGLAAELATIMKNAKNECIGLVKPSETTPYDAVVAAHDAAAKAGLTKVGLWHQPESK